MTGTEKMAALMRRLRIEMNGAVADAMREYGGGRQGYGLNYGVSLPTIKDVAREYAPDHELARLLWRQDVRELKIAALFIDEPAAVTAGQMEAWSADWRAPELAEQCAMQLFWRSPAAFGVAAEWASREMPLRRLAAFYMLGKLAATDSGIADTEIAVLLNNETVFGPAATERSAVYALREIYRHRPALRGCVTDTLNRLPQETANEVRWQVEYIE
ncbi:DNA alkylation repair protein [uncultured Rikenella sp.]|uniref:DNA alkylation repair protein n=1 Tax=uncultured Rikenella sp. TaxID=368003 RepID=UPI00260D5E66|nr:DNA alkylation repair protein [uncultured Rikenella sp.]